MSDYELYIVEIGERGGRRYAERHPLNVPLGLARGNYEDLSDMAVRDVRNDLDAELLRRGAKRDRREDIETKCGGYDPALSQFRGGRE